VPPSDPVVVSALVNGEWQMTISGVAPNCDVVGENPRVVNVSADGTLDMPFDIACQTPTEIAYAGVCGGNDLDICVARSNGGSIRRVTSLPGDEGTPKWSSDGTRIAFVARTATNRDIHVVGADGSGLTRLTTHDAADYDPAWSPDGSRIVFVSERDGNAELYVMNANGSDIARLTNNPGVDEAPAWSPDGTRIAYRSEHVSFGPGNGEIVSIRPDGTDMRRLTADGANDNAPAWSPDGSKIAFARFTSCYDNGDDTTMCQSDIFTMGPDGGGVTRVGGIRRPFYWPDFYYEDDEQRPSWSPDGRKIAVEMTSCASDGHCHTWTGISVITVGAPGFTDFTAPAYAPSWKRN
jgi:Tol biopolymer transport system component